MFLCWSPERLFGVYGDLPGVKADMSAKISAGGGDGRAWNLPGVTEGVERLLFANAA